MSDKVTAELRFECTGHSGPIYTICNGIEPGTLFSGGSDKVVACWSTLTGKQTGLTVKTDAPVFSICTIPEANLLLIGLNTGSVHVVDIASRKELKHLKYHTTSVFDIVYDALKKLIYTCDASGNLVITNAEDFSHMASFPHGEVRIRDLHLRDTTLFVARGDGIISALETGNFNEIYQIRAHENGCNTIVTDTTGSVYSGGKDAWLKKWDIEKYIHGWPAHTSGIYDLVMAQNNTLLVSASRDKMIKCWDPATLDPLLRIDRKTHKGHSHSVNKLAWEPGSQLLWSAGDDRRILGWDLRIS
ncbi:MAG: WD40 repeat domain-containing protein [Flavobacteriales bacterium]